MKMERRHFELVARVIKAGKELEGSQNAAQLRVTMAEDFASEFAKLNPLFDAKRFYKACEVEP